MIKCTFELSEEELSVTTLRRVFNRFFGIRDLPHLKAGIGDLKAKGKDILTGNTGEQGKEKN